MSKKQANTSVSQQLDEALTDLKDTQGFEHRSDAIRHAVRRGLTDLGYLGDGAAMTPARRLVREIGKLLLYVAGTLAVLSIGAGPFYTMPAVGVFFAACATFTVDRWLIPQVEPALTRRLPRVEVRDRGEVR